MSAKADTAAGVSLKVGAKGVASAAFLGGLTLLLLKAWKPQDVPSEAVTVAAFLTGVGVTGIYIK